MARDNYNYGKGKMGDNSSQNRMIRDVAREIGVDSDDLSKRVHELKDDWYSGDYSYSELKQIAQDLKKNR